MVASGQREIKIQIPISSLHPRPTHGTMATISEAYAAAVRHFQAGDMQRAEAICSQINLAAPDYSDAWYFRGLVHYSLGDRKQAIELIRRALELSPDDAEAHNNLGVVLCSEGKHDEAMGSLQSALRLRPDYVEAHNNLGVALKALGRPEEAIVHYRAAVRIDPDHADSYTNLGNVLSSQGRRDEAIVSFRLALDLDREHSVAKHMMAACTGADVPERASDQFVRTLFDKFAGSFEQALGRLDYRAPQLVSAAMAEELPNPSASLDVLDAGCGTGLCGPRVRPYARRLVGVDLSPAMLDKARAAGAYDELVEAELTAFTKREGNAFDVIVSVDTLIYFGALEEVLAASANATREGGHLVFTLEHASGDACEAGYRLDSSGRYQHAQDYVERTLDRAGFAVRRIDSEVLRRERGQPVAGLVITARKTH